MDVKLLTPEQKHRYDLGQKLSKIFDGQELDAVVQVLVGALAFAIYQGGDGRKAERLRLYELVVERLLQEIIDLEDYQR